MKNYIVPNDISFGEVEDLEKISDLICLDEEYEKGGLVLYSDTTQMLVSTNDSHSIITGTTGSRKTRSVVFPMVLNIAGAKEKQSMIVHDPKGDVPKYTYDYLVKQGYEVYVLNFRDPTASDHYNVFDSITDMLQTNKRKSKRMLGDISYQIFEDGLKNEKDAYWLSTVTDYFSGLYEALCVFTEFDKKYVNFSNLMTFHRIIKNAGMTRSIEFKQLLRKCKQFGVAESLSSVLENASETRKNLYSMINNPFATLDSISEITYKSDFCAKDLAEKPVCVFLVTPDESEEYNFMISLIVKQMYSELLDYAAIQKDNTLPRTVNFIVDEFGSLPKIDSFNSMISASRSRNIRFHLILQTYSQLRQVYSEFGAVNIFNNCEACISMRSNDSELEEILRRSVGRTTLSYSNKEVELIPNGMLRTLDKGQAIILAQGVRNPVMVRLPDISEYSFGLKYSDCIDRVRDNDIPAFDFDSLFDKKSNAQATIDDVLDEFKERENEIEAYNDLDRPTLITKNISNIPSKKFDILIIDVDYGRERKMFDALMKITNGSAEDVAKKVKNLAFDGDRILLRCITKKQFEDAIKRLESLGRISYDVDDSHPSSRPFRKY